MASASEAVAFDDRATSLLGQLTPAEQRVARFFMERKHDVLLGSAAQIAEMAGASDATVVRTARSLGFAGLSALREVLLTELTGTPSPARRLELTLDEAGAGAAGALRHVVGLHESVLEVMKEPEFAARFAHALHILSGARRRHIFGIGPSGALADYAALQFNRIGLGADALSVSGVGLADRLLRLGPGDAVLMMAYAPLYREASVVLDEARRCGAPVVLVSDTLGPLVADQVAEVLSVPRGKADHLAMHGGTMVLIEAMIIGLAAQHRQAAIDGLDRLSTLRGDIDKSWMKRGTKKKSE
ncbi:MAG: MurR/RpiR family transcriptional regulator [Devosia sp.]|nr:MurR/RpiR family transcriptional regulator [Devosia sp.]